MSMEHPDLGHGKSFFTDSPMWRNASLTCSCVADGAAGAPSNTKRHVSFKDCMSLIASIALPRHHQSNFFVLLHQRTLTRFLGSRLRAACT